MPNFVQSTLNAAASEVLRRAPDVSDPLEYLENQRVTWEFKDSISEGIDVGYLHPHCIFDIFISYSSKDALAVIGVVLELVGRDYSIYIDCFDPTLNPKVVDHRTAENIRRRMVQSRRLFVAATQHSPASDWEPWELGFTDGLTKKAATLFINPEEVVDLGRQSYFSLNPEVRRGSPHLGMGSHLIIGDPQASPPWQCNWIHWLMGPRRY